MRRLAVLGPLAAVFIVLAVQACTRRDLMTVEVTGVVVEPTEGLTIYVGDTRSLTAAAQHDKGTTPDPGVIWETNDSSVIEVSPTGVVTGLRPGSAIVFATFRGVTGQTTVEVLGGPQITATPGALVFRGAPGQPSPPPLPIDIDEDANGGRSVGPFEVTVEYAEGASGWLSWVSDRDTPPAVITVTPSTSVLGVGTHRAFVVVSSQTEGVDTVRVPVTLTMASMTVSATGGGSTVTESGGTDRLDVVLDLEPTGDVVLDVTSADASEVSVAPPSLRFTNANWDVPQSITLTGVPDGVIDGDQVTLITVAVNDAQSDEAYHPVPPATQAVTTIDGDVGLTFAPTEGSTTAVEGGATDSVTVVLAVRPDSDVFVELTVDDPADAEISPTMLTFTPDNWSAEQTAEFRAVDDAVTDGTRNRTITATIAAGSDPDFVSIPPRTLPATTIDDEIASFTITVTNGSTVAVEGGQRDTIRVVLGAEPVVPVVVEVTVDDPADASVNPSTLAFTGGNWSTPQVVTFEAVDDGAIDGNGNREITVQINSGSDPAFVGLPAQTVPATTIDDDAAEIAVTETNGSTVSTEGGASDSIAVALVGQPLSNVVIDVSVDLPADATVDPPTLTFNTGNSATPQWVVFSAVDDDVQDGNGARTITLSVDPSSDPIFAGLPDRTVAASTVDDDSAGFLVSETGGTSTVNESGSTDAITVVLTAAPVADVVLSVTSADLGEVTVEPTTLTFTPANWDQGQTVTLTGVDDGIGDSDQTTQVSIEVVSSADPEFAALPPQNIAVTTVDDDIVGFAVAESNGSTIVSEDGSVTDEITVRLNSLPVDDVVFQVTASDPTEATVSPSTLTFTSTNGTTPRQIVVTPVDDAIVDGPVSSLVTVAVAPGPTQDPAYLGLAARTVGVTTTDDEVAGITLTSTAGKSVDESGGIQDAFMVALDAEPTGNVVLTVSSSDAGEVGALPATLTFTPANFATPQAVDLTGVDDDIDDGDQISTITVAVNQALTVAGYDDVPAETVGVTTTDDDVAGITLTNTAGKSVDESGATQDAFSVVLDTQPTSNVVLSVSSSDAGEVTTQPTTLTFTPQSWSTPQVVTLTGVDDVLADGNQISTVTVSVNDIQSDDAYDDVPNQAFSVTTTDDDVPGLTLTNTVGKTVDESGTQDAFSVALNTQPLSNVVLTVTSSNTSEVTVQPATLTFTPQSWSSPQVVTLIGVDDGATDGPQTSTVTVSVDANQSDDAYDGVAAETVTVETTDNDVPGFALTNAAGKTVDEGGATQDVFSVALDVEPISNVVLSVTSSDAGEVSAQPTTLTFTPQNFATPQDVTLTGADDAVVDGDQLSTVTLSVVDAQSDPAFADVPDEAVSVTTTDNDVAGITLTNVAGKTVGESGAPQDAFSVALEAEPTGNVVLTVSSSDAGEVSALPTTLTFTPQNFGTPQAVNLTGIDDDFDDGDQISTITVAVNQALTVAGYDGVPAETVDVTTTDDDVAGITLTNTAGKSVDESGATQDAFSIALDSEPTSNVVLTVTSSDAGEVAVQPATLTFTPQNFATPQAVTLTGADDLLADGDQLSTVTVAVNDAQSAVEYADVADETVTVTTTDDDVPGITLTNTAGKTVDESATQDAFSVVLDTEPATNVVLTVTSSNTLEVTVQPATLTFTPANFATPQTVILTGVDDAVSDGDQVSVVTVSVDDPQSDAAYTDVPDETVSVTTTDNDVPGITLTNTAGKTVDEAGATQDVFSVALDVEPASNVVVSVTSSNTGEVTVQPATLTFTPQNFAAPQTVTLTGVDDAVADGDQTSTVTVSVIDAQSDPAFADVPDEALSVTTTDDEVAGITLTNTAGKTVGESGAPQDAFSVALDVEPAGNVVLTVSSSDAGEVSGLPTTLTFTPLNFATPQAVNLTGVDDAVVDGDQISTITVAVNQALTVDGYDDVPAETVTVTTTDDDVAGVTLTNTAGKTVGEGGTQDAFSVALDTEPTGNVVLTVSSSDAEEVSAQPATLTFTPLNYATPQTVTLTGVDDALIDGDQLSTVTVAVIDAQSAAEYADVADETVSVTTTDNDVPGITLTNAAGKSVDESGTQDAFSVVLNTQPATNVVLTVTSSNTLEVTVQPATLTFTPANFATPQTVTLTGVDDAATDGDQISTVTVSVDDAQSDADYVDVPDGTVTVTTTDDDVPGMTLTNTAGKTVDEAGTTQDVFSVVLDAQPTSDVVLTVTSSNTGEVSALPATLTFTTVTWSTPQNVTLVGVDDSETDGNQISTVTVSVDDALSDAAYADVPDETVAVTTIDDDSPGMTLVNAGPKTLDESGPGSSDAFSVVLDAQPTSDVVITVTNSNEGELAVAPTTLTFTPANFLTPQSVTLDAIDDDLIDGDQLSTVTVSVDDALSAPEYADVPDETVTVTIVDDEEASFLITETGGTTVVTEGGGLDTFEVVLTARPGSPVRLTVTSLDEGEVVVEDTELSFSPGQWNLPQTVVVTGVDDAIVDGDVITLVTISVNDARSDDLWDPAPDQSVSVTTEDDDGDLDGLALASIIDVERSLDAGPAEDQAAARVATADPKPPTPTAPDASK